MSSSVWFLNLGFEAGGGLAVRARGVDLHWHLSMRGVVGVLSGRSLSMIAERAYQMEESGPAVSYDGRE